MQRLGWNADRGQALGQAHLLGGIVTEQHGALQVVAFGLWTIQYVIEVGTGEVIAGAGWPEFEYALGIPQRRQRFPGRQMQLTQIA